MLKIYFTASTSHNGELIPYYKKLLNHIKKHPVEVLSGDQVVDRNVLIKDKQLTALEIFNREKTLIDEADIMIAELSKPSLGVGAEIVYALNENKPVLAMVRNDYEDKISPILLGNPSENLFFEYYRNYEYKIILDKFIDNMSVLVKHSKILRQKNGKLIVIEGGDGSGKTTQVKMLSDYFHQKHYNCKTYDFPQYYSSFHGKTIARFLRGEFGSINQVSPYLISLAFAVDRVSVKKEIDSFLKRNGYIIANRYATSSIVYQAAKFNKTDEQEEFIKWNYELEYEVHKMPKEDLVIYLHVPWKIGIELTAKKTKRDYLKGQLQDIHEENIIYRQKVENMYLKLSKRYNNWIIINCVEKNKILPPEIIHQKILNVLRQYRLISK